MLAYLLHLGPGGSAAANSSLAATALIDGRTASGILMVFGALTCAALLSSAARLFRQIVDMLRDLLRLFLLTVLAALVVCAVVLLAFADLLRA